jgi:hypothetical protein
MSRPLFPLRYLGWMARDVLLGTGLIMLAVAGLVAFGMSRMSTDVVDAESAQAMLRGILSQSLLPLTLVATGRIVSGDLANGYYRSYFARPVAPPFFYLQRWLLGGVALLAYVPLAALAVSIRAPGLTAGPEHFRRAGLVYLLVGGTVFLLSTVTSRDWLGAALLYVMQAILNMLHTNEIGLGAAARFVYRLLPPFHIAGLAAPSAGELRHAVGYGVLLVLAALAALRWRPLGSGGRA